MRSQSHIFKQVQVKDKLAFCFLKAAHVGYGLAPINSLQKNSYYILGKIGTILRLPNIDDKSKNPCSNCHTVQGLEIFRRSVFGGSFGSPGDLTGTPVPANLTSKLCCCPISNCKLSNFRQIFCVSVLTVLL